MSTTEAVALTVILASFAAGAGGIWLIVQRQSPGTWAMMVARQDAQEAEIDALKEELLVMKEERAEDRSLIEEWQRGMKLVFEQMRQANLVPVWTPGERVAHARTNSTLAKRIAQQFSVDEINNLAFDIGVLADEFGGATREARARELVDLVARRGTAYASALAARVNELRGSG